MWPICHFGPVCGAARHCFRCAPTRGFRCGFPARVSGVGNQVTDGGACPPRRFVSVHPGSWSTYQGRCPSEVSGVGPRPLIGVRAHWGTLGQVPRQPGHLSGPVPTRSFSCGRPVSLLIWVRANQASGTLGLLIQAFTVQGLRWEGRQRPWLLRRVL